MIRGDDAAFGILMQQIINLLLFLCYHLYPIATGIAQCASGLGSDTYRIF